MIFGKSFHHLNLLLQLFGFLDQVEHNLSGLVLILLPGHLLDGFLELSGLGSSFCKFRLDVLVRLVQLCDSILF